MLPRLTTASDRPGLHFLSVAEVAERLRVHPSTVRRHIRVGRLGALRVGRLIRVRPLDLQDFLHRRWPPSPKATARLTKVMGEIFARRDARPSLDISTLELVRASRRELEERTERYLGGSS